MKRTKIVSDYFLLYLLIGISSTPLLVGEVFLALAFILALLIFMLSDKKIDPSILKYSSVFFFLFVIHALHFNAFDLTVFIAFFLRIFYAYFTVKIIGKNIAKYTINIIYFFALISLGFWIVLTLDPTFENYLVSNVTPFFYKLTYYKDYQHLVVLTINFATQTIFPRNPGPFWEAGGFGVYLNLALLLNLIATKEILNIKNIVLIIAILTTQSTGSYITFGALMVSYFLFAKQYSYIIFLLPLFIFIGWNYFKELRFLDEKIESQWEYAQGNTSNKARNRFVSAKEDLITLYQYPLAGKGRFTLSEKLTAEQFHKSSDYRNNGTTIFLAEFGLIGFIFFFSTMYRSLKKFCIVNSFNSKFALAALLVIIISGFSQTVFAKPFFIAFSFMFLYSYRMVNLPKKTIVEIGPAHSFISKT